MTAKTFIFSSLARRAGAGVPPVPVSPALCERRHQGLSYLHEQ